MVQPLRPEHGDKTEPIADAPGFAVRRALVDYAYPANGNTHNPTPRYQWLLLFNDCVVDQSARRGDLVNEARRDGAAKRYADETVDYSAAARALALHGLGGCA